MLTRCVCERTGTVPQRLHTHLGTVRTLPSSNDLLTPVLSCSGPAPSDRPPLRRLHVCRAVSPQLDDLWRVLWEAHRGRGATPTTRARPTASARHRARSRTPDVAVAAAQRLVLAFSELRQLGSLLASLMASWREWEAAAAAAHPAGAASWLSGSSAPVAVLSSPALLEALCGAVALLPSGERTQPGVNQVHTVCVPAAGVGTRVVVSGGGALCRSHTAGDRLGYPWAWLNK